MEDDEPINISDLRPDYTQAMDLRGKPTTVCVCGCAIWNVKTIFDTESGEVSLYFRDMECAQCGTLATAPIPIGLEDEEDL
jgi:hypothetical protein